MHSAWFKGISDKDARRKEVKSFRRAFEELNKLLEEETIPPDYDCPSWAYKQADQNGFNRAIRKVKSIISIEE